tara:strand:+ start:1057 stop:3345 length:2289 start_codon:yes stop_codon:yes gene_type:complete
MARFVEIQTNFTTGELDPLVRARVELKAYDNALETAKNVICQPQGGVTRRPGTKFINELAGTPANGVRLIPFEFSVNDSYMLCFTNDTMYVYKNKVLVHTKSSTGIVSAYLDNLCWTQSADTLIVVHEDMAPRKIVRNSDTSWTVSTIAFKSIPNHAFTLSVSNPAGTLTPSDVSGKITLTASSAVFSSGNVGQYINASPQGRAKIVEFLTTTTINVVTEFPFFDTSAIANGNWDLETGYEDVWSGSKGWPRSVTFHQGRLFFGGSKTRPSTIWGSKVGLYFDFEGVEGLDDDAVEATLDTNTFNAIVDMISGQDLQCFTTGGEFYVPQEGLSPITPSGFFLSTTSRNGCKEGLRVKQLESGTLFVQRQGKALSEIAYSDTQLTYLTSKISLLAGHLLKTPKRMDIRRAVATDENDLLLITNEDDGSITAFSLLRAQDVIAPSEFTTQGLFKDVGVDITDIYVVTTRTDGLTNATIKVTDYANIAVGTKLTFTKNDGTVITLQSEAVGSGSPSSPSGNTHFFRPNASNNATADNIYTALNAVSGFTVANPAANIVSVARDNAGINNLIVTTTDSTRLSKSDFLTIDKYYVEVFDDNFLTDCAVAGTTSATANMAHLQNNVVNCISDGYVELNQTVPSGGSITFTSPPASSSECGLPISVEIKTMPLNVKAQAGTRIAFRKRVIEVNALLHKTQNIVINGNLIPIRSLGSGALDSSVPEFTGTKTLHGILGYSTDGQITVTQSAPLKLTLLGLEYKVSVYQGR